MNANPIDVLNEILKRNRGEDVDLRNSESDRWFLFDRIENAEDLDLAWKQFPRHEEIRARAEQIDAAAEIVPGWGYRTPKQSNRCSDEELIDLVRRHLTAFTPFLLRENYNHVATSFLDKPYRVQIVTGDSAPPENNELYGTLYEAISEFKRNHISFESPINEVLYDWAVHLTKCDEVAVYLLWPALEGLEEVEPHTPDAGFALWSYGCRDRYWIKDNDPRSGIVCVQPPGAQG